MNEMICPESCYRYGDDQYAVACSLLREHADRHVGTLDYIDLTGVRVRVTYEWPIVGD